jgi:hypothetical protein
VLELLEGLKAKACIPPIRLPFLISTDNPQQAAPKRRRKSDSARTAIAGMIIGTHTAAPRVGASVTGTGTRRPSRTGPRASGTLLPPDNGQVSHSHKPVTARRRSSSGKRLGSPPLPEGKRRDSFLAEGRLGGPSRLSKLDADFLSASSASPDDRDSPSRLERRVRQMMSRWQEAAVDASRVRDGWG